MFVKVVRKRLTSAPAHAVTLGQALTIVLSWMSTGRYCPAVGATAMAVPQALEIVEFLIKTLVGEEVGVIFMAFPLTPPILEFSMRTVRAEVICSPVVA